MKQKLPRYEMHKYWGKKPPKDLSQLIKKYTNEHDIIMDPFSGYGVFVCESILDNRRAISNDLNPISTFIQKQLLNLKIDIMDFKKIVSQIVDNVEAETAYIYKIECPKCGNKDAKVISALRNEENFVIANKIKCSCTKSLIESETTNSLTQELEDELTIPDHPNARLIRNGRISAKANMYTDDLFTKRALFVHSKLLQALKSITNESYKELALFTFTSNLANCSRLVPPIKTRGSMSSGAWMTGFYTGKTYIENNVLHYFNNRLSKTIKGKEDYLNNIKSDINQFENFESLDKSNACGYLILNEDAKDLPIPSNSVDYIFTDFPYGDTVPYFEQSIIWNTWLDFSVNYEEEIVVSDSPERDKNGKRFELDIGKSIQEIYRTLKTEGYFTYTFHSLEGDEWYSLIKACLECGFSIVEIEELKQKTLPPRQLNRKNTIKGDMIITFSKTHTAKELKYLTLSETIDLIEGVIDPHKSFSDNYVLALKVLFSCGAIFNKVNIAEMILDKLASPTE